MFEPKETKQKKPVAPKKRKAPPPENEPASKAARVEAPSEPESTSGIRRSGRNAGKTIDYSKEILGRSPLPVSITSGVRTTDNEGPMGRDSGSKRMYSP